MLNAVRASAQTLNAGKEFTPGVTIRGTDWHNPASVQVMNDEEGLRGCWFAAGVAQLCASHALVSYADLQDEGSGASLQEWFPLPGMGPGGLSAAAAGGKRVHAQPGYMLRPAPPAEVPRPVFHGMQVKQ